jgi:hypothetical protein
MPYVLPYIDAVGISVVAILSFLGEHGRKRCRLELRFELLPDALHFRKQIPVYGETCLYDAVYDTLDRLEKIDGKKLFFC